MNTENNPSNDPHFIEPIERMKEVDRIQYDYFKNFTIISSTAILIIFAFYEKIAPHLCCWQKVLLFLSLLLFFSVIVLSLFAMQHLGNSVRYSNGLQDAIRRKDERDIKELSNKIEKVMDDIHVIDLLTKWPYMVGMGIIVCLAAFLFFL